MIAIVDYGSGNINALCHIYARLNIAYRITSQPEGLKSATGIILPGVGAFDQAISNLEKSGMKEALGERVRGDGIPLLGICVGMQLLASCSEEGVRNGLGWVSGTVKRFQRDERNADMRLPHMGWNTVELSRVDELFYNVDLGLGFYFLHSYYFACENGADQLGSTRYGIPFGSVVNREKIYGVQFHPEKSHQAGVQLLANFAKLAR